MQGALLSELCAFAEKKGNFKEDHLSQLEACQSKLARRLKEPHRKLGKVPIATELRIRRLGRAKKLAQQIQNDDQTHQQVLAAIFGQTRLDKYPGMNDDGKLTTLCHAVGKAVFKTTLLS